MLRSRYTIFNHSFKFGATAIKGSATDREFAAKIYKLTGELIASGQLKPNPIKKYPQGLASVEQGFKDAEAGKVLILRISRANRFQVRAAKVVYTISEKP
jgi:hypothetical protein